MSQERLDRLETITPRPLPPWRAPAFEEIEIELDREAATEKAKVTRAISDMFVYSDAPGHHNYLGAATVALDQDQEVTDSQQVCVGPMDQWSVHVAELIGIFYAISLVLKLAYRNLRATSTDQKSAMILCDSTSALQAIQNPGNKSGQRIIRAILQAATEVEHTGPPFASSGCPDTVTTPGTTQQTNWPRKQPGQARHTHFDPFSRVSKHLIQDQNRAQWEQEWKISNKGSHFCRINTTLPST